MKSSHVATLLCKGVRKIQSVLRFCFPVKWEAPAFDGQLIIFHTASTYTRCLNQWFFYISSDVVIHGYCTLAMSTQKNDFFSEESFVFGQTAGSFERNL